MRVLIIGPSPEKSKGGMATVIKEIKDDMEMSTKYDVDIFDSYVDGNIAARLFYSVFAYFVFLLTKRNYDVYHIHAASRGSTFRKGYYVRTAKRWGKKVIFHIHGGRYMEFYNEISLKKKATVISILKLSDLVVALSQEWKDKFDQTFGLTNCVVLENGINIERLAPAITDKKECQNSFVALSRLRKGKGTYDLINAVEIAVRTIPNIVVYLAGDGDISQVQQLVEEKRLSDNIIAVGWVNFEKKLDLLKRVATVVLPSYNEGLPMSILEGMACGKAIVSTKVGAIPEVIKEDNGILVEAGDIKALAEALIKCSTDLKMITDMGNNNYQKIQKAYSMKAMHSKLMQYYDRFEE